MTVNWTKRIGRIMFGTVLLGRFLTGGVEAAPIEMQVVEGDVRSASSSIVRRIPCCFTARRQRRRV